MKKKKKRNLGATVTFFGQQFARVSYNDEPEDYDPNDINLMFDDPQCKLCAVEPNYCKTQHQCHDKANPFVFVKSKYIRLL